MLDNESPRLLLTAEPPLGALIIALIEIGSLLQQILYLVVDLRRDAHRYDKSHNSHHSNGRETQIIRAPSRSYDHDCDNDRDRK